MAKTKSAYVKEDVLSPREIKEVNARADAASKTVNYTFVRIAGMGNRLRCVRASYRG